MGISLNFLTFVAVVGALICAIIHRHNSKRVTNLLGHEAARLESVKSVRRGIAVFGMVAATAFAILGVYDAYTRGQMSVVEPVIAGMILVATYEYAGEMWEKVNRPLRASRNITSS